MSLNAAIAWEIRTTGNDANGGGFKAGATGTDRSLQDAPHATLTAASVVHSLTNQINVAPGDYTVSAADVGNVVQLAGGTATAGFFEITTADVPNNRWSVDRAAGTVGQTCVGRVGGALASLGKFGSAAYQAGNKVWIKAGTYLVTSATINISGGCFTAASLGVRIEGYQTTRGDLGTKPLLQASGIATFTLINFSGLNGAHSVANLKVDGAGLASSTGITTRGYVYRCEAVNCTVAGFRDSSIAGMCVQCSASGCSGPNAAFYRVHCVNCVAVGNTCPGFSGISLDAAFVNCLSVGNTGATTDGFVLGGSAQKALPVVNCVAYGNGRDGFRVPANTPGAHLLNCVAEGNAGWGFNLGLAGSEGLTLTRCAGVSNTLGNVTLGTVLNTLNEGFLTGSSTFFVDGPGKDFALNATVGGGALLREAGTPGAFPGIPTTGAIDVGAAQTGAGGGAPAAVEHATVYVG